MSTKKQHYIPRFILKRFAFEITSKNKYIVYLYNTETEKEICVDIASIKCFKNYLYELKKDNEIVNVNLIEKMFSKKEHEWNKIFDKIEKQEKLVECEIKNIKKFVVLQLLRTPNSMELWIETMKQYDIDLEYLYNYFKVGAFYLSDNNEGECIFKNVYDKIAKERKVLIGYTNKNLILNTELPVLLYEKNEPTELIYIPISPNIIMGLLKDDNYDKKLKVEYKSLSDGFVEFSNMQHLNTARFVISKEPIKETYK